MLYQYGHSLYHVFPGDDLTFRYRPVSDPEDLRNLSDVLKPEHRLYAYEQLLRDCKKLHRCDDFSVRSHVLHPDQ